jgi:hypothetical protein
VAHSWPKKRDWYRKVEREIVEQGAAGFELGEIRAKLTSIAESEFAYGRNVSAATGRCAKMMVICRDPSNDRNDESTLWVVMLVDRRDGGIGVLVVRRCLDPSDCPSRSTMELAATRLGEMTNW